MRSNSEVEEMKMDIRAETNNVENINKEKENEEEEKITQDVECAICLKLLIVPVTTPCGHNFCKICLEKSREYKDTCPLCRTKLSNKKCVNILLGELIKEKYPVTYDKRMKELENVKLGKEMEILEKRTKTINNTNKIPLMRIALKHGPNFPNETFYIRLFDENAIQMFLEWQPQHVFAVIPPTFEKNIEDSDLTYAYSAILMEREKQGNVLFIKAKCLLRIVLRTVDVNIHANGSLISYVPIFDDTYSTTFKLCDQTKNSVDLKKGKKIIDELNNLIMEFEYDDPYEKIKGYYEKYESIIKPMNEIENYHILSVVKYNCCVTLANICLLFLANQLKYAGKAGLSLFYFKFSNLRSLPSDPTTEELENISYSICCTIIAKYNLKWKWFKTTDTLDRYNSLTTFFLNAKSKSILALDYTHSPIINRLFMLDSITSSVCVAIFLVLALVIRYYWD